MKKLVCMFTFFVLFVFLNSCNSKSLSLKDIIPEGESITIEASFSNSSTSLQYAYRYTIVFYLKEKTGNFNLKLPPNESEVYDIEIQLSDDDIININRELDRIRFKLCKENNQLTGSGSKYISLSYFVEDQGIYNIINTEKRCVTEENRYYFTSSYKSLYDLFIEIIDAQDGDLPEGWQDKI